MKKQILILSSLTALAALNVQAATLAQYNFAGGSGADTAAAADITTSTFSGNGGGSLSSSGNAFIRSNTTTTTLSGSITDGDYWEFSVTVAAGYQMDLTSLSFDHLVSINGGTVPFESNIAALSSVDGFTAANALGTSTQSQATNTSGSVVTLATGVSTSLSAAGFQGLTGTTTFRFYVYDDDNSGDSIPRIDNVILDGTVTQVPEPSSALLMSLAACAAFARRTRRA